MADCYKDHSLLSTEIDIKEESDEERTSSCGDEGIQDDHIDDGTKPLDIKIEEGETNETWQKNLAQNVKYSCEPCKITFSSKTEVGDHIRAVHMTCAICKKMYKLEIWLQKHMQSHFKSSYNTAKKILDSGNCNVDAKSLLKERNLSATEEKNEEKEFAKNITIVEETSEIDVCGKDNEKENEPITWKTQRKLSKEEQDILSKVQYFNETPNTKSSNNVNGNKNVIGEQEDNKDNLNNKEDQFNKKYKCDICNGKFTRNYSVLRHLKKVHKVDNNKCLVCACGKTFRKPSRYMNHVRFCIHVSEQERCLFRPKPVLNSNCLRKHKETYSKNNLFTCDYCGKVYNYKYNLKRHILTHMGIQSGAYRCNFCSKSFARKAILTKHLFSHETQKMFSCKLCEKKFKSKWGCSHHEKLAVFRRCVEVPVPL